MAATGVDGLDPDYWVKLGKIADKGKELLLLYDGEEDPCGIDNRSYDDTKAMFGDDLRNPFTVLQTELDSMADPQTVEYLERQTGQDYGSMRIGNVMLGLAEFEQPHENVLGANGMEIESGEVDRLLTELSTYVESALGDTDLEGVEMTGEFERTHSEMVQEAESIADVLYQTARNV